MKKKLERCWPYLASFGIPILIMTVYFIYRQMAPFGSSSVLTTDSAQQYAEFFAYFRRTLLHDPRQIFFSFASSLGSDTFGLWAYYLLSPLNLLFLLFSAKEVPGAMAVVTLLKYGLSGLAMSFALHKLYRVKRCMLVTWSVVYALNGWIIANQLNIMWLDALYMLPLIFVGLNALLSGKNAWTYIITVSAMIIINFYMAYMILLFTVLYFAYYEYLHWHGKAVFEFTLLKYICSTAACALLTAVLWVPTYLELLSSKESYPSGQPKLKLDYAPYRIFAKLFAGSYNFRELQTGMPNIFVGSLALIGFVAYFCSRRTPRYERIATAATTFVIAFALIFDPLQWLMQAGEFPIWYTYRFSYIFCFWIIIVAAQGMQRLPKGAKRNRLILEIMVVLATVGAICAFTDAKNPKLVKPLNVAIGLIIFAGTLAAIVQLRKRGKWLGPALLLLAVLEMGFNACACLNNFDYLNTNSYNDFCSLLARTAHSLPKSGRPYRIGKSFFGSPNDPIADGYMGTDAFSSTLERQTAKFMSHTGQDANDNGSAVYANGTPLTDRILGVKYIFDDPHKDQTLMAHRFDLSDYPIYKRGRVFNVSRVPHTLPMLYVGSHNVYEIPGATGAASFQQYLYDGITGTRTRFFYPQRFRHVRFYNVKPHRHLNNTVLKFCHPKRYGYVTFSTKLKSSDPYYMETGNRLSYKNTLFTVNGVPLYQHPAASGTLMRSIADDSKGRTLHVKLRISPDSYYTSYRRKRHRLWVNGLHIFRLDRSKLRKRPIDPKLSRITRFNSRGISADVDVRNPSQALLSSIPDSPGWHLTVDGKPQEIVPVDDTFIGSPLAPGKHHVELTFRPPGLTAGAIVSAATTVLLAVGVYIRRKVKLILDK